MAETRRRKTAGTERRRRTRICRVRYPVLKNKHIVLGVTGGIAAYKSCYLVREFKKAGADVKVIMTEAATKFVTPLTFSTLSEHEAAVDLWDKNQSTKSEIGTRHVDLATWADVFLIGFASEPTVE